MSDEKVPMQATPAATLEQQVMDCRIAKSEREWWASREIERLRAQLAEVTAERDQAYKQAQAWSEMLDRVCAERDALVEALVHIGEYWNGNENERAMADALHHIDEVVTQALAAARQEKEGT